MLLVLLIAPWTVGTVTAPPPAQEARPQASAGPAAVAPATLDAQATELDIEEALVVGPLPAMKRGPLHVDPVEARIVRGDWTIPHAGDTVTLPNDTTVAWQSLTAGDDGWFKHAALGNGYLCATVTTAQDRVVLLEAVAHGMVYVNGEPRVGDPYQFGNIRVPVQLRAGLNELLFRCGREQVKAKLRSPAAACLLEPQESTLPDLRVGEAVDCVAAVLAINATPGPVIVMLSGGDAEGQVRGVGERVALGPLSMRKLPFHLRGSAPSTPGELALNVGLVTVAAAQAAEMPRAEATLKLRVRTPEQDYLRTFVSAIDGSVQYYAVQPAAPQPADAPAPGLMFALHGAGVDASGLITNHARKPWAHVVAPTNRRPFGFDWEDWGRLDFLEVERDARQYLQPDPQRIFLTGHSMGGHGVWQIGATFPDHFAAIGPSAGWISFWSYTGAAKFENPTPIEELLQRAAAASDTLTLSRNYLHHGVYILHGDQDDNVPVEQARTMRRHLAEYHADFAYYERPGAGHWWGSPCVDWVPMLEFFQHHTLPAPADVRHVEFVTANPAVSARCNWASIKAQTQALKPSKIDIKLDAAARKFSGTTDNVARLALDLTALSQPRTEEREGKQVDTTPLPAGAPLTIELDDQTLGEIPWPTDSLLLLGRDAGQWSTLTTTDPAGKNPDRGGPFKQAFARRMLFVYGTQGTPQENAWALAKARFDAETFWYRGNGSIEVIPDKAFSNGGECRDRHVILYGHADSNAAWPLLLAASPIQVRRGEVRVGDRTLTGEDLACLFLRPRPDGNLALVGVVGGSGAVGMRLTDRLPYFVSGVGYPDWLVCGPEVLTAEARGVRGTGYFGNDWSLTTGEAAWALPPQ